MTANSQTAGSYMISSSILVGSFISISLALREAGFMLILKVPAGSYIVGEVWSQLVAFGSSFADESNPQALIVVGNGDTGNIEMQDLLFTSVGNLPGLVLVEWNINAASQGSAAMWGMLKFSGNFVSLSHFHTDCHFRVGGALGTDLQVAQCPIKSGGIKSSCIAASISMFIMD
jgi:hypothetical protein